MIWQIQCLVEDGWIELLWLDPSQSAQTANAEFLTIPAVQTS